MRGLCTVDGCTNEVEAAGLCPGHRKRKVLGKPVEVPLQPPRSGRKRLTPWQLLEKAIEEYSDCDVRDDVAFRRVLARVAYAARAFARSRRPSKLSRPT